MMPRIHYKEMLKDINGRPFDQEGNPRKFQIKARYTSGAQIGKVYRKTVRLHHRDASAPSSGSGPSASSDFHRRIRRDGMLALHDGIGGYSLTVPIWAIIEYEGQAVNHTYITSENGI